MANIVKTSNGDGKVDNLSQYGYTANTSGFNNSQTFSHTCSNDCILVFTYFSQTGNGNRITLSSSAKGFQWKSNKTVYGGNDYAHAFGMIPNAEKGTSYSISFKGTGSNMGSGNKQLYAWYEIY